MDEKFWEKINTYGENGEFDKVVKEIKKLPEDKKRKRGFYQCFCTLWI